MYMWCLWAYFHFEFGELQISLHIRRLKNSPNVQKSTLISLWFTHHAGYLRAYFLKSKDYFDTFNNEQVLCFLYHLKWSTFAWKVFSDLLFILHFWTWNQWQRKFPLKQNASLLYWFSPIALWTLDVDLIRYEKNKNSKVLFSLFTKRKISDSQTCPFPNITCKNIASN